MCIFFKGMHLAWLRCATPPCLCSQGSSDPLLLKYLIITLGSCGCHLLFCPFAVQKHVVPNTKYFSENGKINTSGGILTMQGLLKNKLCQSKTLISQHCTCLGYFHMEKSCLSGFGNYVAFALLEIPVGPSNSNSCTFHHSSFSVFLSFCFFYFISHLIAFQITKKKGFSSSPLPDFPYECSGFTDLLE